MKQTDGEFDDLKPYAHLLKVIPSLRVDLALIVLAAKGEKSILHHAKDIIGPLIADPKFRKDFLRIAQAVGENSESFGRFLSLVGRDTFRSRRKDIVLMAQVAGKHAGPILTRSFRQKALIDKFRANGFSTEYNKYMDVVEAFKLIKVESGIDHGIDTKQDKMLSLFETLGSADARMDVLNIMQQSEIYLNESEIDALNKIGEDLKDPKFRGYIKQIAYSQNGKVIEFLAHGFSKIKDFKDPEKRKDLLQMIDNAGSLAPRLFLNAFPKLKSRFKDGGYEAIKGEWQAFINTAKALKADGIWDMMQDAFVEIVEEYKDPKKREEIKSMVKDRMATFSDKIYSELAWPNISFEKRMEMEAVANRKARVKVNKLFKEMFASQDFRKKFNEMGFKGEVAIIWHLASNKVSAEDALAFKANSGFSQEVIDALSESIGKRVDVTKYLKGAIGNIHNLSNKEFDAIINLISSLPTKTIDASSKDVSSDLFDILAKGLENQKLGGRKYAIIHAMTSCLKRSSGIDIAANMYRVARHMQAIAKDPSKDRATQDSSRDFAKFIFNNLLSMSDLIKERELEIEDSGGEKDFLLERINSAAGPLFVKTSAPWGKWLDPKKNPKKIINVKLYVSHEIGEHKDALSANGFEKNGKFYVNKRDYGDVTVKIELVNIDDDGPVDVFKDLSNPNGHFIVYSGHAGRGRSLEMREGRDDSKPLETGEKVLILLSCNSMPYYYARSRQVAPNSQMVGTTTRSDNGDDLKVLFRILKGAKNRDDWATIAKGIKKETKGDASFDTNYIFPNDSAKLKYALTTGIGGNRGNHKLDFKNVKVRAAVLNGTKGATLAQAAQNAQMMLRDRLKIPGLQIKTRQHSFDGVYFDGKGSKVPIKVETYGRDVHAIEVNQGYAHLSQAAMTVLIMWEVVNKYARRAIPDRRQRKLTGVESVVNFVYYRSSEVREEVWGSFKRYGKIPDGITYKDMKDLLEARIDAGNKVEGAKEKLAKLREDARKKF